MKNSDYSADRLKVLQLLSREYPTIQSVSSSIININAILHLPKGTEHFMSDLHGEAEAFNHIMNNCSGVIREKVDLLFSQKMSDEERRDFCTLIYYPQEKLEMLSKCGSDTKEWYKLTLLRLVDLTRSVASKYTRKKVRNALPDDFQYIIDELLHTSGEEHDKQNYYSHIISTIIEIGQGEEFIVAMCSLIKRMAVDCLHVIGDIFDRGPYPDKIMDILINHHNVDIQWGNHDVVWMGAAAGSPACIAAVLNMAIQYNTLSVIENTYGISLRDLIGFAQETYERSNWFMPRNPDDKYYVKSNMDSLSRAHKAIAIIMFKLEGQIIKRHPEYDMDSRLLLDKIDITDNTVTINGVKYRLVDSDMPTVYPSDPYRLCDAEEKIMDTLVYAFKHSEALQRHIDFLYRAGSLYKVYNDNLLYHGCIPMTEEGKFDRVTLFDNEEYYGKSYMDRCDSIARSAYYTGGQNELDFMYYLWCGKKSPLFGREKMTTFERYFVEDRSTWVETKNPYYRFVEDVNIVTDILSEFGLDDETSHIVNGHVPVKVGKGENPIKGGGKYILIDGGFCKAYHDTTGIAGYTLIYSSKGLRLVSHSSFAGKVEAIRDNKDIIAADDVVFELMNRRKTVADTDEGKAMMQKMYDLMNLLDAYRCGIIKVSRAK